MTTTLQQMKNLAAAIVLSSYLAPASALGMDISYDAFAASFFPAIESLTKCGSWKTSKKQGEFRVFSANIYGGNMLFADMVYFDEPNSQLAVERGFAIQEIDNDHAEVNTSRVKCLSAGVGRIKIVGSANTSHEPDREYRFCVLINGVTGKVSYSDSRVQSSVFQNCTKRRAGQ